MSSILVRFNVDIIKKEESYVGEKLINLQGRVKVPTGGKARELF